MKEKTPLSIKLEPAVHKRLEDCAEQTKIKKYNLAIMAIEAAVEAIEKNGYKIVVPIQFDVTHVPTPRELSEKYPTAREGEQIARAEDREKGKTKYPSAKPDSTILHDQQSKVPATRRPRPAGLSREEQQ